MNTIIILTILAIVVLLLGISSKKQWLVPAIFIGLLLALVGNFLPQLLPASKTVHMLSVDSISKPFTSLMLVLTFLIFLIADHYFVVKKKTVEDVYAIILFSLIGAVILTMFTNMVMFFIGLEIMSVSLYILAGSKKTSSRSNEAAMKYFLMGTFSTGVLLLGITLIYGATGSFDLAQIGTLISSGNVMPSYLKAGILLLTIGVLFKIGAVPFHFWVPDVYHGAPTLITTYMATVVKIAGVVAFYRLYSQSFMGAKDMWTTLMAVMAVATIFVGNLSALHQDRVKRMLAYSSIAHTGYLMLALVAFDHKSVSYLFYYMVAYSVATIGVFSTLMLVRENIKEGTYSMFEGLAKRNSFLSFGMAVSLISLTGLPPLAGFMAKYLVFVQAINEGYLWLAIAAIIGTAISVVYYFRIIVAMYMKTPSDVKITLTTRSRVLLSLFILLTIALGVYPDMILNLCWCGM